MVISVDKFTAVKMYDKVQRLWKAEITALRGEIQQSKDDVHTARMKKQLEWMRKVKMAVVVSAENGEEEKFDAQSLDIRSSSVVVHGTTAAEYRKTDTTPRRNASAACRGSTTAAFRWVNLSIMEDHIWAFSYLQSLVSVILTPSSRKGCSGSSRVNGCPRYWMESVARGHFRL
jgi:hypothetical protein